MTAGQPRRASGGPDLLKIITILAAVGFVLLLGFFVLQMMSEGNNSDGGSGPRLVVDKERIDFGRVVYDKTVRAIFTIKNAGDQPLQIAERQIQVKLVEGC